MTGSDARSSIMSDQKWDSSSTQLDSLDLPELVLRLLSRDAVHSEASLGVIDEPEVLASLLNCDHVHEARWVSAVGSDFTVDFDIALHEDRFGFTGVERIF